MAYRFLRAGTTPTRYVANPTAPPASFVVAQAPVPAGDDDAAGYSNLNQNAESDPVKVSDLDAASVFLFSDTSCAATLTVAGGPTSTGPWATCGVAAVNPSLATPAVVNVFANGRVEYVIVTTSGYASGNPRALLVG